MVINEFLPNPVGKDQDGEWIELFNNKEGDINLNGWQIKDASGKTFIFKNQKILSNQYAVLDFKTTKISLNNSGETIELYNQKGDLIDKAEYVGVAAEGKSFSKNDDYFVLSEPTPGKENIFLKQAINESGYEAILKTEDFKDNKIILEKDINLDTILVGFFAAIVLSAIFIFSFRKISEFFD